MDERKLARERSMIKCSLDLVPENTAVLLLPERSVNDIAPQLSATELEQVIRARSSTSLLFMRPERLAPLRARGMPLMPRRSAKRLPGPICGCGDQDARATELPDASPCPSLVHPAADPYLVFELAGARGLLRYVTGKSCKRGHVAERWMSASSRASAA